MTGNDTSRVANGPESRDIEAHIADGGAVILFDGACNLCNASVRFVTGRDPRGHFAFASLQSDEAERLLSARNCAGAPRPSGSVLLVEGNRVHERSVAALRVARRLRGAWPLLWALLIVPRPIRDAVYDWIARNRYRWFGRTAACSARTSS